MVFHRIAQSVTFYNKEDIHRALLPLVSDLSVNGDDQLDLLKRDLYMEEERLEQVWGRRVVNAYLLMQDAIGVQSPPHVVYYAENCHPPTNTNKRSRSHTCTTLCEPSRKVEASRVF